MNDAFWDRIYEIDSRYLAWRERTGRMPATLYDRRETADNERYRKESLARQLSRLTPKPTGDKCQSN